VNIASRCAGFVHKSFEGKLAGALPPAERARYDAAAKKLSGCAALFESRDYAAAMRLIMDVADEANAYVAEHAPWLLAKDENRRGELHTVCTLALNYFRLLTIWLSPVVPAIAERAFAFLGATAQHFENARTPLLGAHINAFTPLTTRVDPKKIEAMIEASKESLQPSAKSVATPSPQPLPHRGGGAQSKSPSMDDKTTSSSTAGPQGAASPPPASHLTPPGVVTIDDFARLDLRVGKVLVCEPVEGSDKLLRFELDAGELGKRQIFSGIKAAYPEPHKLVGRSVVFIANLAPRKMRFGISEGMILSAGSGGADLFLLDADQGAQPGMPVK
jgi:methionyl-tRNA synthetase